MATETASLLVKLQADTDKYRADLAKSKAATLNLQKSANDSFSTIEKKGARSMQALGSSATLASSAVSRLAVSLGGLAGAATFVKIADDMTNLESRIRLTLRASEDYETIQNRLLAVANESRVSISDLGTLYARIAIPLQNLGATTDEVVGVTDALAKGLLISGASTAEAQSAILQFSQAMASGVLRGEEFNAVNEAAPVVMRKVAEQLGVTQGELRKMAEEGQLTASVVSGALLGSLESLNAEVANIQPTVAGSFVVFRNELAVAVGKLNEATGITAGLSSAILGASDAAKGLTEAFNTGEFSTGQQVLIGTASAAAALATVYATVRTATIALAVAQTALNAVMRANPLFLVAGVATAAAGAYFGLSAAADSAADSVAKLNKEQAKAKAVPDTQPGLKVTAPVMIGKATKAGGGGKSPAQQQREEADRYIGTLKREADTLGMTEAQMRRYELSQKNLTKTQRAAAEAQLAKIDAFEKEEEARKKREELGKQATGVIEGLRTPEEAQADDFAMQQQTLDAALEQKLISQQEYADATMRLNQQVADHERSLMDAKLAMTGKLFGDLGTIVAGFAGEQSAAAQAMFAVQKAFSIAQSIIAIQTGIAQAAAIPFPANLAAMASVAAATASIVSTIQGTNPSFDGGGFTGFGPRSGGVDGKGGFPAILHPNESVIDHTKGQRMGGGNTTVVQNIQTSDATSFMYSQRQISRRAKRGLATS